MNKNLYKNIHLQTFTMMMVGLVLLMFASLIPNFRVVNELLNYLNMVIFIGMSAGFFMFPIYQKMAYAKELESQFVLYGKWYFGFYKKYWCMWVVFLTLISGISGLITDFLTFFICIVIQYAVFIIAYYLNEIFYRYFERRMIEIEVGA